jgi:two-component system LytT family response regulator
VTTIRTLIVDDEPLARRRIRSLLKAEAEIAVVGEAGNGPEAIEAIHRLHPQLVFLDVEMPEMDGFDVLRALDQMPTIIFVTAHKHYAIAAFEARALDYVLKPVKPSRFREVVGRARNHIARNEAPGSAVVREMLDTLRASLRRPEPLIVKSDGRVLFLRMADLRWVEAEGDYVRLHMGRGSHLVRDTMTNMESRLPAESFLRIHRSTIVNLNCIQAVQPLLGGDYSVTLGDGTRLTLSRNYRAQLVRVLQRSRVELPKSQ